MKKVVLIMTMLVMSMGVSFTTNAQTQVAVYNTYDTFDVSDWVFSKLGGATQATTSGVPIGAFVFSLTNYPPQPSVNSGTAILEQSFNMLGMNSIDISFDVAEITTIGATYTFEILLSSDGSVYTSTYFENVSVNSVNTFTVTNNLLFSSTSTVKIILYHENLNLTTNQAEGMQVRLIDFSITGNTSNTVSVAENYLSESLDIYSYNKSVFLTADDYKNVDVSIYNMNGQIVESKNMNLSTSKSEINLDYLESGMYVVSATNNVYTTSKQLFIK